MGKKRITIDDIERNPILMDNLISGEITAEDLDNNPCLI